MELIIIDEECRANAESDGLMLLIEADGSVGDMHRSAPHRRELAMTTVDGRLDATMVTI